MYSVCEQCCDCIPSGVNPNKNFGALSVVRGNCPAHAFYDICKVFPKVAKFIQADSYDGSKDSGSPACGALQSWTFSSAGNNWASNNNAKFGSKIKNLLESHNSAAQCDSRQTWGDCYSLEHAQKRV